MQYVLYFFFCRILTSAASYVESANFHRFTIEDRPYAMRDFVINTLAYSIARVSECRSEAGVTPVIRLDEILNWDNGTCDARILRTMLLTLKYSSTQHFHSSTPRGRAIERIMVKGESGNLILLLDELLRGSKPFANLHEEYMFMRHIVTPFTRKLVREVEIMSRDNVDESSDEWIASHRCLGSLKNFFSHHNQLGRVQSTPSNE